MGKKKRKELAKKINDMIETDDDLSTQEIIYAGIGVLVRAADKGSRKVYRKAVKKGRAMLDFDFPAINELARSGPTRGDGELRDPVISYRPHGGGWFNVEVGDTVVDRVQGETDAAARAGSLLEGYAAQDSTSQEIERRGTFHTGGGWYQIVIDGVPIDRVQGQDAADQRFEEILAMN